jgi:U32 family peptidase
MKPKLLAPAGDFTSLKAVIDAGCDEVYFGIKDLNMRAGAKNFSLPEIKKAVRICHLNNVQAHLAINTIIYEKELKKTEKIIAYAKKAGIDAVICWDMAIIRLCMKYNIEVHLSTQASVSNYEALKFYKKNIPQLKRVILARECSLEDIKKIIGRIKKDRLGVEIEVFIHGAMCVSVSGRCFLSQDVFGKSANRGECLQPCRRQYIISDAEENHGFVLGEDYILSPKDLCVMPFIDKLIKAGIHAFKIEGRNRSPEYAGTVVSCYRQAIDSKDLDSIKSKLVQEMKKVYNRGFSSGFFLGKPIAEWSKAYGSKATERKTYIGRVLNYYSRIHVAEVKIESGALSKGDKIMFQGPTTGVIKQIAEEMQLKGAIVKRAEKKSIIGIKVKGKARKNDKLYKIVLLALLFVCIL